MGKLIIDGNSVYEIDEECIREKQLKRREEQKKMKLEELLKQNPKQK